MHERQFSAVTDNLISHINKQIFIAIKVTIFKLCNPMVFKTFSQKNDFHESLSTDLGRNH